MEKVCVSVCREGEGGVLKELSFKPPAAREKVLQAIEKAYGVGVLDDEEGDTVLDDQLVAGRYTYRITVHEPNVELASQGRPWLEKYFYENVLENIPPEVKAVVADYKSHTIGLQKNAAGIAMFKGAPSLLLHYPDVATERLAEEAAKATHFGECTVILAGPSGCGKTKLLYSFFSSRPGFYLCATTQANGGSNDITTLLSEAVLFLKPEDYQRNRLIVRVLVLLLLASRMAIYRLCQGLSNKEWLIFQAACRGFCRGKEVMDSGTYDIFNHLFKALVQKMPKDISEAELRYNIHGLMTFLGGCPDVAVDEAQVLLTEFEKGYFTSVSLKYTARPISNTFFEAIKDALGRNDTSSERGSVLLVCGTGYTLHLHLDLASSGALCAKHALEVNHYLWFGIWEKPKQMVKFARDVLPDLSEEDRKYIELNVFPRFRGRFRPFVSVVEQVLLGNSFQNAALTVEIAVTETKKNTTDATVGLQGSIYDAIVDISQRATMVRGVALYHLIERAAIQFHCYGRGLTLASDAEVVIDVLEYGLGVVTVSAFSERCVELSEYLVLKAAEKFFLNTRGPTFFAEAVLQRVGDEAYPSSQGLNYQSFLPLLFELMWDKFGGCISNMPIFKPALQNLPSDPRYNIMRGPGLVAAIQHGQVRVAVHTPEYQTREFLLEKSTPLKRCTTLICEERLNGGADTITKLNCKWPEQFEITVVRQCKLLDKPQMSPRQFKKAVNASNIMDRSLRVLCGKVLIRMVDIFPVRRPAGSDWFWWEIEGDLIVLIVVLDAETGVDFFGTSAPVVEAIKKGAPVLEMFEEEG